MIFSFLNFRTTKRLSRLPLPLPRNLKSQITQTPIVDKKSVAVDISNENIPHFVDDLVQKVADNVENPVQKTPSSDDKAVGTPPSTNSRRSRYLPLSPIADKGVNGLNDAISVNGKS